MNPATPQPAPLQIQPRYLDVEMAAQYLGMTPGSLYKSVQRRQVPYRKKGKRLVFDQLALDAWIQGLEGVDVAEAIARQQAHSSVLANGRKRSGDNQPTEAKPW